MLRKKLAIFIARRKKVNFKAVAEEKFATFIARRNKMNLAAVTKEKTDPMFNSKTKSGFCSSC